MKKILILLLASLFVGCASTGPTVHPGHLDNYLRRGETTIAQADHLFGEPNSITINTDGTRTYQYTVYSTRIKWGTVEVPVTIVFDNEGKLVRYSSSEPR